MREPPEIIIRCENVCRTYAMGEQTVHAVREVSFCVARGEFVAIVGPSGSGKSTLLNLLGALDQPTSGALAIRGRPMGGMTSRQLAHLRSAEIGFVFQQFNLLRRVSALENVALPLRYASPPHRDKQAIARARLAEVGLGERLHYTSAQLSGGQQQRVAIARALVNDPAIILADEPTGALDTATSQEIMQLLARLNDRGQTVIVVTHDVEVAAFARRVLHFRDGRLVEDRRIAADTGPALVRMRMP